MVFRLLLSLFLCHSLAVFSQGLSYEFKSAVPPEGELVLTVDPSFYGTYRNEQTGTEIVVNDKGITMVTIIVSFITKEQVRESSKYDVRNGYLFGVKENDSIPCVLEGEHYYFGIKQEVNLRDEKHQALIKRISATSYVLNFVETKGYSPTILKFEGNSLSLQHFTYTEGTTAFQAIKLKDYSKEENYQLVLLSPTQFEWNALDRTSIFDKAITFQKL